MTRMTWTSWRTCAAVVLAGLALACGAPHEQAQTAPVAAADPSIEVETAVVSRGAIQPRVAAPGSLVARRQSEIGAEVQGRIERVFVNVGDRVAAGDPLFQIDRSSYEAQLAQARAGADLAKAERMQVESDLERALALRRKDVMAEQQVEKLRTGLEVARAHERQAAQAVELASLALGRTLVRAPYAASVAQRLADEGTTARTAPQTVVVVLQEVSLLEARVAIPESQLHLVQIGDHATLRVQGLADPIDAQVTSVSDAVDPATRTYLVKMAVPNPDHALKSGVFVHVEITPRRASEVVLVPRRAVRSEDGESRVFVIRDGRAVPVTVRLGLVSESAAQIVSGVSVGEEVIVGEAISSLAAGQRVRVVRAERPEARS